MLTILQSLLLIIFSATSYFKLKYIFQDICSPWTGKELNWMQKLFFQSLEDFAKYWHRYEIHGLEHLDRNANESYVLVGYHSRPVLDLIYFFCTVKPRTLIHYMVFQVPILKEFLAPMGFIPSKLDNGKPSDEKFVQALIESPVPVMLLPGGVVECLKPSDYHHKVIWKPVPGYIRVLFEQRAKFGTRKVKVVPFYTRNCESIYYNTTAIHDTFGNYSIALYQLYKEGNLLLFPILLTVTLFSFGNIFYPRPVKLDTYIAKPLVIEETDTPETFAGRVRTSMESLIDNTNLTADVRIQEIPSKEGNRWYIGMYAFIQNLFLIVPLLACIWIAYPLIIFYSAIVWLTQKKKSNNKPKSVTFKND
jgi:hypothetical protein